ncbi:MAG: GNAT family N-acetyltransferase [Bosea sp. (in: a-proteobacteria)]
MDWLRKLLKPGASPARTGMLDVRFARHVAALHHQGGFARGWEPGECAALIADPAVVTDGVFAGPAPNPAGFVLSRKAADEAEILSIVVQPGHRREGLGRILLGAHLNQLARIGIRHVYLEVEDGNRPAEQLYRGLGFREVGRRQSYYLKPDGTRASAVTMRLDLA